MRGFPSVGMRAVAAILAAVLAAVTPLQFAGQAYAAEASEAVAAQAAASAADAAASAEATSTDPNILPAGAVEDVSLRTETSNHYELSDGTMLAVISEEPVNYQDESGAWQVIDTTLVRSDELGRYEAASTEAEVSFGRSRLTEEPVQITSEGYTAGIDMAGVTEGIPSVSGSSATYSFVAPSTDLVYEATNTGIKETLVLDSPSAPSTFTFTIDAGGLTVRRDFSSSWGLYSDESTEAVFMIGALTVFDSTESTTGEPAYCEGARMQVTPTETGAVVTYTIPEEWMNDPARVFPVMVDPSLDTGASDDTFVSSAAPTTSYGSSEALSSGYYDSASGNRRSYLKFNLASIPSYARVDSATLSLYQYYTYYTNTATTTYLGKLTGSWTESVTWNTPKPAQTALTSQSVTGRGVWVNWSQSAVKDTVAAWVAGTASNYGFSCYQLEDGSQNTTHYRWFCSSEHATSSLRPKLVVTYTTIPDAVTNVSASAASSFGWFREVDRNADYISDTPNDVGTDGRGEVSLSWAATARAAGYAIYAWDGDAYTQVGKVFGSSTTTWTSEGAGIYPSDSTISGWTAGSRNAFSSAGTPSVATLTGSIAVDGADGAGVVVSDGTFLYVRAWSTYDGPTAWQKVGTGLNGTVEGRNYGQIGIDFASQPILSAFYLDGVIYNGYATSSTTVTGVPKSAQAEETSTVTLTFDEPLLVRSTGAEAAGVTGDILLASDGERIYSVASDSPGGAGYEHWVIRVFDRTGHFLYDRTVSAAGSYYTDGVICDGENLYLLEATGTSSARVTKVSTDTFTVSNQWTNSQSPDYAINGCYDAANNVFYLGCLNSGDILRYSGTGLDLRDNPEALYEKGTDAAYYDSGNYWFRVVPYNLGGESAAILDCAAYAPTLENRTVTVNDEDRDTVSEIGEMAGHQMSAVLDEGVLDVSVTDLAIASYGPAAAVSRNYSSARTSYGLLSSARGWRFSFEKSAASVTGGVAVTDESGVTRTYVLQGGVYSAPNGCYDTLTSSGGNWTVVHKDRSRDVYSQSTGKIAESYDKAGNAVIYTWGTNALTITAANGQTIQVSFNTTGKITSAVYATEDGTRTVTYSTGASPCVTYFDGDADCEYAVTYAYTSDRLTSMSVPDYPESGQTASWAFTYNGSNRLSSAKSPTQSDAQKTVYTYDGIVTEMIDDTDSAAAYTGTWIAVSGFPACYSSTYHYSYATNSYVTFSFSGTAASFIGSKGPAYGKVDIYVDGVFKTTIDCYAATAAHQQTLYTVTGLSAVGSHTVKAVVKGEKSAASTGYTIIADVLNYTPYPAVSAATVTSHADVGSAGSTTVAEDAAIDTHYTINPTGTMASMTDPHTQGAEHADWSYTYAPGNEAVYELAPSGTSVSRLVDSRGNTTSTFDEEGHRTTYIYDALDQLIRETDPRGCTTYYTYGTDCYQGTGLLTVEEKQLTNTERSRTEYTYESSAPRRLVTERKKIDASSWAVTSSVYSTVSDESLTEQPLETTQEDVALGSAGASDLVSENDYDAFGNVTGSTDASGAVSATVYDIAGRATAATDPAGVITQTRYDILGNVTETWREAGSATADRTEKAYDASGRLTREYSVLTSGSVETTANTVEFSYDASGRETESDNFAVAGSAVTHYDARGNAVLAWIEGADTSNRITGTRSTYNVYGQIINEAAPSASDASATVTAYFDNGLVRRVDNPDASWTEYTYDDGGLKLTEATPASQDETATTAYRYDIGGRLSESISADGAVTAYTYDLLGRQVSAGATGQDSSTTLYNSEGWELSSTDSDHITKSAVFDAAGRVIRSTEATDQVTTTVYDGAGRRTCTTDADANTTSLSYDAFSRVATETQTAVGSEPVKTTVYEYDSLSRVTRTTVADHRAGTTRSTAVAYSTGGITDTLITFSAPGSIDTTLTLGTAGIESSREVSTPAGAFTRTTDARDSAGRATAWTFLGVATSLTYDSSGRIIDQQGAGFMESRGNPYYFNASGRKMSESLGFSYLTPLGGGLYSAECENNFYTYGVTGRLVSASIDGDLTTYAYEAGSGNLTGIRRSGETTTTLAYTGSRVTTMTAPNSPVVTFGWDAKGRRTSETKAGDSPVTFEYSDAGRLVTYADPNRGVEADYVYDARGQRTSAVVSEGSRETTYTYTYDGLALLHIAAESAEGTQATAWTLSYLYDESGRPYAGVYDSSETSQPVLFGITTTDRGDVRALTEDGIAFVFYSYDAYGNVIESKSQAIGEPKHDGWVAIDAGLAADIRDANALRYAGYAYDRYSGLYYLSQRYYDPTTASFITKDPAKADGEESAYQYCGGDPVGKVDPSGLWLVRTSLTTGFKCSASFGLPGKFFSQKDNIIANNSVEYWATYRINWYYDDARNVTYADVYLTSWKITGNGEAFYTDLYLSAFARDSGQRSTRLSAIDGRTYWPSPSVSRSRRGPNAHWRTRVRSPRGLASIQITTSLIPISRHTSGGVSHPKSVVVKNPFASRRGSQTL